MMKNVNKVIRQVQGKLAQHGMDPFQIHCEIEVLHPRTAGLAHSTNKIKLNLHYMQEHEEQMLAETLPHEICHLYVNRYFPNAKQAHGPEFRRLMRLLGCKGDTHHNMKLESVAIPRRTKKRFEYRSEDGQVFYLTSQKHNKMKVNPRAFIARNGQEIKFTGVIASFK